MQVYWAYSLIVRFGYRSLQLSSNGYRVGERERKREQEREREREIAKAKLMFSESI